MGVVHKVGVVVIVVVVVVVVVAVGGGGGAVFVSGHEGCRVQALGKVQGI